MRKVTNAGEGWLSLTAAAARLNVHAATLRRWADEGEIPFMLTPGRHRRFAVADLDRFAASRRVAARHGAARHSAARHSAARQSTLPEVWAAQAITRARREIPEHSREHWLATLDQDTRDQHRALGQRLMGLTLQYVSSEHGEHLLEEARKVGADYGRLCKSSGLPLTDALQAALFFRDRLLDATLDLSETARVRPGDNSRLVKRINALLNVVQLAVAEIYETQ